MPFPTKATLITLSLVPVVAPAVYFLAVHGIVSSYVATSGTKKRVLAVKDKDVAATSAAAVEDAVPPHSLPDALFEDGAPYVITCERVVSKRIPISALTVPALATEAGSSEAKKTVSLLTSYLRGTMEAFSWTPQGLMMRAMIRDPAVRHSFDADYLQNLSFVAGDLACGFYKVTYRGGAEGDATLSRDRTEFSIVALADRPGLVVHGVIVAEVELTPSEAVFINETWLWRHAQDEKPTMLESSAGRWLHSLVGGWMLFKGSKKVTAPVKAKAE